MKIVSREEARRIGARWYCEGVPCRSGHIVERLTERNDCVQCVRDRANKWNKENPERLKLRRDTWRQENLERDAENKRKWYNNNRERALAQQKASRDPQKVSEYNKWWRVTFPEKKACADRTSKARRKGADGRHTAGDIVEIRRLQRDRCAMPHCRIRLRGKGHIDHIIALVCGGSNSRRNLQLLCPPCNLQKGAKHPIDHVRSVGMLL